MSRLARAVLPQAAHLVTQRGNRGQDVFCNDQHYAFCIELIAAFAGKAGTQILAYCLMPGHVHFAMVPRHADGLRATLDEAHRRYTRDINGRDQCRGHVWQERFRSFPMDQPHLGRALRYIELTLADWPWSTALAHLRGANDALVRSQWVRALTDDWAAHLQSGLPASDAKLLELHSRTGRPLGNDRFSGQRGTQTGPTPETAPPGAENLRRDDACQAAADRLERKAHDTPVSRPRIPIVEPAATAPTTRPRSSAAAAAVSGQGDLKVRKTRASAGFYGWACRKAGVTRREFGILPPKMNTKKAG